METFHFRRLAIGEGPVRGQNMGFCSSNPEQNIRSGRVSTAATANKEEGFRQKGRGRL